MKNLNTPLSLENKVYFLRKTCTVLKLFEFVRREERGGRGTQAGAPPLPPTVYISTESIFVIRKFQIVSLK